MTIKDERLVDSQDTATFSDGLGRRSRLIESPGAIVETLRLCRELADAPTTESAIVERAGRLSSFAHPTFAPVERIDRLGGLGGLAIVSRGVYGVRLYDLLKHGQRSWSEPTLPAALSLLVNITNAMSALHACGPDVAHGALGPQRIIVQPDGRPVIVEQVLGPAIELLQLPRTRLWTEFRIPVPAVAGTARFDQLTDVMQLGVLALSLVLGRLLGRDDFPARLGDLLTEASTSDPLSDRPVLSRPLRSWISRTLQFETRSAFRNAIEAARGLEAALAESPGLTPSLAAVVKFVDACAVSNGGAEAETSSSHEPAFSFGAGVASPVRPTGTSTGAVVSIRPLTAVTPRLQKPFDPGRTVRHTPSSARSWLADAVRVSAVSIGLVSLFGMTYLGARGFLPLPGLHGRTGTVVVESRPAGADVYVDGLHSGRTPATLEIGAGEHTLTLRTTRSTTLVPVTVVAGAKRSQFVELRPTRKVRQ